MRIALLAPLLLAGCASIYGYGPPTEDFARAYGCDYEAVMQARKDRETEERPRVGWTACEVFARYGSPYEADVQESEYGRSATWWFKDPMVGMMDPKLVRLERRRGSWIVTYVGW